VFFAMCRLRSGEPSPHHRTALAECLLELVHGPMRRCFRLQIGRFLGVAYRPPGSHQPPDEIGLA
jgi:hypothetical protein